MKSVCCFCNHPTLIRWGKRRRQCQNCKRTFRVARAGRKNTKVSEMYLLDRSTFRRIAHKEKRSHVSVIHSLQNELKNYPKPIEHLKKIYTNAVTYWWSMASTLPSKEKNIVNI